MKGHAVVRPDLQLVNSVKLHIRGFPSARNTRVPRDSRVYHINRRSRSVWSVRGKCVSESFAILGQLPLRGKNGAPFLLTDNRPGVGFLDSNGQRTPGKSRLVRPISSHSLGLASATKGELVLVLADGLYRHLICDSGLGRVYLPFPNEGVGRGGEGADSPATDQN